MENYGTDVNVLMIIIKKNNVLTYNIILIFRFVFVDWSWNVSTYKNGQ